MAIPTNREGLIDYCRQKLGAPVIEINVDYDQIEDRIDDAIQMFQQHHMDASVRTYVSHQASATDIANKYITVGDNINMVTRVFPFRSSFSGTGMFGAQAQFMQSEIPKLLAGLSDLAYYEQTQQYLSMLDDKLNGEVQSTFSYTEGRLYIHGEVESKGLVEGQYIVYEAFKLLDPESNPKIWDNIWLKSYSTALIKRQWGTNLMKFEGMQMPGGVMFTGRQLFDDANSEIEHLEDQLRTVFEEPIGFFIG